MKRQKQTLAKMSSNYQPRPGKPFYQRMERAPWNKKETMMPNRPIHPTQFGWQVVVGCMLALILLSFGIPAVRASLSAWLGLSVAPSNQMPANAVTLVAVTPPPLTVTAPVVAPMPTGTSVSLVPTEAALPTQSDGSTGQPAEIYQLSAQVGWEIPTPGHLPEGYHFESAYYDTNHQMVILTYLVTRPLPGAADPSLTASKTITLLEAQKNDFIPMQVAPDTNVEDVQVNGQAAAYAIGAWDAEFVKDDQDPNGGKMVSTWRNDLPVQNLYWQVDKVYLVLVTDDETISKQELIDVATSAGK